MTFYLKLPEQDDFFGQNICFVLNRCVFKPTVCTVTGSTVIDFHDRVHSVPDLCVYSLMKSQGSSSFELLAGFRERRRLDVPFVDHLKLWLNDSDVTIYLERGGRAQVRGKVSLKGCSAKGPETAELLQFVGRKAAEHVHCDCDAGGVAGTTVGVSWPCVTVSSSSAVCRHVG